MYSYSMQPSFGEAEALGSGSPHTVMCQYEYCARNHFLTEPYEYSVRSVRFLFTDCREVHGTGDAALGELSTQSCIQMGDWSWETICVL
jgi:hypothetical protein